MKAKPRNWCEARTVAELVEAGEGWAVWVASHYDARSRRNHDLGGFIDLIALHPIDGTIGIQATSHDHHAERVRKVVNSPEAWPWLLAGNRIWVISWGDRADGTEYSRRTEITTTDLEPMR